jgi:hypothetical protein
MEMAMWGKLGRMGESIFRRRTAEVEKQFVAAFSRAASGEPIEEIRPVGAPAAAAGVDAAAATAPAAAEAAGPETALSVNLPVPVAGLAALGLLVIGWLLGRGRRSAGASR